MDKVTVLKNTERFVKDKNYSVSLTRKKYSYLAPSPIRYGESHLEGRPYGGRVSHLV